MSKDTGFVQDPAFIGELVVDFADVSMCCLPVGAALNTLLQSHFTPLNIAIENIIQGNLGATSLDDVTTDL